MTMSASNHGFSNSESCQTLVVESCQTLMAHFPSSQTHPKRRAGVERLHRHVHLHQLFSGHDVVGKQLQDEIPIPCCTRVNCNQAITSSQGCTQKGPRRVKFD